MNSFSLPLAAVADLPVCGDRAGGSGGPGVACPQATRRAGGDDKAVAATCAGLLARRHWEDPGAFMTDTAHEE